MPTTDDGSEQGPSDGLGWRRARPGPGWTRPVSRRGSPWFRGGTAWMFRGGAACGRRAAFRTTGLRTVNRVGTGPIHRGVPSAVADAGDDSLFRVGRSHLQRGYRIGGCIALVDVPDRPRCRCGRWKASTGTATRAPCMTTRRRSRSHGGRDPVGLFRGAGPRVKMRLYETLGVAEYRIPRPAGSFPAESGTVALFPRGAAVPVTGSGVPRRGRWQRNNWRRRVPCEGRGPRQVVQAPLVRHLHGGGVAVVVPVRDAAVACHRGRVVGFGLRLCARLSRSGCASSLIRLPTHGCGPSRHTSP